MSVYAVADLHGRYDLFQAIKNFITPEDRVYVLGDCGDRGKDGWQIIKEVYENPQFIYIKGNHEAMLVDAMRGDRELSFYNGGKPTYEAWKYKDGGNRSWATKLKNLPVEQIYVNTSGERVVLCHAGYTPHCVQQINEDDYIWNREHFNAMWDVDFANTIMVHGHTPIPYMDEYLYNSPTFTEVKPGAFWYSPDDEGNPHKVNIDCGAVFTGCTVLLNLDTWDEQIFMADDCVYAEKESNDEKM